MIAYITCVTPSLHGVMHVIIVHCLAAYVLHLVCMIFGTAIPTLFNILMKMFLLLCKSRDEANYNTMSAYTLDTKSWDL